LVQIVEHVRKYQKKFIVTELKDWTMDLQRCLTWKNDIFWWMVNLFT